ncbi:hypothetical protein HOD88_00280 [archaeon]|jgi:ribosome biogenesis GTPase A|nr:hypothetical protein [archaeon]
MRVRYSFSSRRTGNIAKMRKQKIKYPDLLQKVLTDSDIILEVLDARFIDDTRNLELEEDIKKKGKRIIYVINKSDLTKNTKKNLYPHVLVTCKDKKGIKELRNKIKEVSKSINKPLKEKFDKIIVGVIGYPNTGKSSLINLLIGKKSAGTGSEAGFTKGLQKLKLTNEITLIDSPGVIPKKEYTSSDSIAISKHTKVGARSFSQVKDPELVVAELMKEYQEQIKEHYKIETENPEELIEELGRKWNLLKKGNEVNFDQTARKILKDWQEGKIKI